jgi:hypothetical protein
MLRETIEWRKNFEIQKIHTEFAETIKLENSTGKMYIRGFDKEGAPLIYMKPVKENTKDHVGNIKHLVYTMERAVACMDAKGDGNTKLSLVIDYEGYTLSHAPPMKTSTETLNILQNHYPERLKCAYCIRAPFVFYAFFKMVSPFIDPVTKKKISMIKNAELGTPACQLSQEIDAAVLESSVGGLDNRPFVSATYLAGRFDQDYKAILDELEGAQAAAVGKLSKEEVEQAQPAASVSASAADQAEDDAAVEAIREAVAAAAMESENDSA